MCSWSVVAGVRRVRRSMNCALARGPMPPRTPSTLSVIVTRIVGWGQGGGKVGAGSTGEVGFGPARVGLDSKQGGSQTIDTRRRRSELMIDVDRREPLERHGARFSGLALLSRHSGIGRSCPVAPRLPSTTPTYLSRQKPCIPQFLSLQ